jgi:RNA polymerase sigma-70 factor (ECF subfamily)
MVADALGRLFQRGASTVERTRRQADLARVYDQHSRYVWRCLRSLGVRDAQLDDAVQDVFMVVSRRLAEFDGGARLSTWLYAIALRVARKYRDRARREQNALQSDATLAELAAASSHAEEDALRLERVALARHALEALDDDKREVFVLARVEQMSAPEIARVVGIPLNTVYSRLRAARCAFDAEVSRLKAAQGRDP